MLSIDVSPGEVPVLPSVGDDVRLECITPNRFVACIYSFALAWSFLQTVGRFKVQSPLQYLRSERTRTTHHRGFVEANA